MRIWNYIGEFFLFRWLFGKLQKSETDNHVTRSCIINEPSLKGKSNAIIDYSDKTQSSSFDNLTDVESNSIDDDLEGLDDLDLFMRNNSSNDFDGQSKINYGSSYQKSSGSRNDCWVNNNSYQSFDDFHEEQDDYDMMDDF